MSSIITNIRVIKPEHWTQEVDGTWYAHIPFECDEDDDTLIDFADTQEYIDKHKNDFDALRSGFTKKNTCVILADHKPTCDIQVSIKKASEEEGRIVYTLNPDGTFEPEWLSNIPSGLEALFGSALNGIDLSEGSSVARDIKTNNIKDIIV